MLSLQQLRVFVLTVQHGKLSIVAKQLGVRQPTVTFHLSKLEQEVGQPIFLSNARQVWRLTDFGQSLFRYAERMIALEDEITRLIADSTSLRRGSIRIGSTHTPATYLLPEVIAKFRSWYPDVDISLDVAPSHLLLEKMRNYSLDICCINHFPSEEHDLDAHAIYDDALVLIAHPDSIAAKASALTPQDFETLQIIMHEVGSISRRAIDAWCQEQKIQPNVLMDVSGTETMKQMVKQNLGVAMISAMSCREAVASGTLISRPIPDFQAKRTIYLVHRKDVQMSNAAEAFLQALQQSSADIHSLMGGA